MATEGASAEGASGERMSGEGASGGGVIFARITDRAIDADECARAVGSDTAGALVTFVGIVRNHDDGRGVLSLHYEAHPGAGELIATIAGEAADAFDAVTIAVVHRTGDLVVGDVALACAVASAHRAEAFSACSQLVDNLKERLPIWKQQLFSDGTEEWVAALG